MGTLKLENKQYLQNVVKGDGLLNTDLFVCETIGKELSIYCSGFNPQYTTFWYVQEIDSKTKSCKVIARIHELEKGMYLELYEGQKLSLGN